MRLIDADKLQKAIPAEEDNITGMGMTYDEMEAYNDGIDEQWKKIVNAPTIEPQRPKGEWIPYDQRFPWSNDYKCSECGNYLNFSGVNGGRGDANFCPSCGVDMRGEQDE